jgi:hypothetical protein
MKGLNASSAILVLFVFTNMAAAADQADPTGAWTWKYANQSAVHTLKLKLEGDKLTGSIQDYQNGPESPIEDAAFKDGIVTFKHMYKNREGLKSVASYTGTITGDTIKGTTEFKHPDQTLVRDWQATRRK